MWVPAFCLVPALKSVNTLRSVPVLNLVPILNSVCTLRFVPALNLVTALALLPIFTFLTSIASQEGNSVLVFNWRENLKLWFGKSNFDTFWHQVLPKVGHGAGQYLALRCHLSLAMWLPKPQNQYSRP